MTTVVLQVLINHCSGIICDIICLVTERLELTRDTLHRSSERSANSTTSLPPSDH